MNSDNIKPIEIYNNSKLKYERIKNDVYYLFENYKHKDKISKIFEYWLWQLNITLSIYGDKGFLDFFKSKFTDPISFSYFLDGRTIYNNSLIKLKKNRFKFLFLNFVNQNFYYSGYKRKNLIEEIRFRISNKLIKYLPVEKDFELRKRILELTSIYFSDVNKSNIESYLIKNLPLLFYSKPIYNYEKPINISCASASFFEFNNLENIFLVNSNIYIKGYQHGGGYGTFLDDYFEEFEKSICDEFIGWGLSEINIKQTRYKKIKKNYLPNKRIIWIETNSASEFNFMVQPYCVLNINNQKNKEYIFEEMKASNFDYFNLIHPKLPFKKYKKFRKKSLQGRFKNVEKLFNKNDIGIFDNPTSSLIFFFLENQIPFLQIISRNDFDRFTIKQKKWFEFLSHHGLSFFNDEKGKLALSLKKIISNDYCIPEEVTNFHKNLFYC